ncbi:hypothetical protein BC828DRAFT_255692 [Blastocladiella britannica]|nr:hypothetical protein BC828DRAFT_255692 [Blastocladiella britannica]
MADSKAFHEPGGGRRQPTRVVDFTGVETGRGAPLVHGGLSPHDRVVGQGQYVVGPCKGQHWVVAGHVGKQCRGPGNVCTGRCCDQDAGQELGRESRQRFPHFAILFYFAFQKVPSRSTHRRSQRSWSTRRPACGPLPLLRWSTVGSCIGLTKATCNDWDLGLCRRGTRRKKAIELL